MNNEQTTHVGMLNSFNLITEKSTLVEIISSGIGIFAHVPDEDVYLYTVNQLIEYFEQCEMYEYCAELKKYINENFDDNGVSKIKECKCDKPDIKEYTSTRKVVCNKCNKIIKK